MTKSHPVHRIFSAFLLLASASVPALSQVNHVVISQVYGGGGATSGSPTFKNDYVELFNPTGSAVNLTGWSIQYQSATGTGSFSSKVNITTGTIPANGYFFIVVGAPGNPAAGGNFAITPDLTATAISAAAGAGKFALVSNQTTLTTAVGPPVGCPGNSQGVVDLIGYGTTANCGETSNTGANLSTTLAAFRAGAGCTDTDANASDFTTGTPLPRNSASTTVSCGGGGGSTNPSATGSATSVTAGSATTFSGTITAGTNPTSSGYNVTCNLSGVGGSSTFALTVTGTTLSGTYTVPSNTAGSTYSLPCTVADTETTPRSSNFNISLTVSAAPSLSCGGAKTLISTVQGTGVSSTMTGSVVTIQGTVIGAYQGTTKLNGFYVQDEGDGNPSTSDGIFIDESVGGSRGAVTEGQGIRLQGTVAETFKQTVINNVTGMISCTAGTITPTEVTFPAAAATDDLVTATNNGALEQYEGMLVKFTQQLRVTDNYDLGRFGEMALAYVPGNMYGDGVSYTRLMAGSQVGTPGTNANAASTLNAKSRILLDDGSNNTYSNLTPSANWPLDGGGLSYTNPVRLGDRPNVDTNGTYTPIVGVLGYGFNTYCIQPVSANPITFGPLDNPRPTAAPSVGGRVRVMSANVLNYFTTYTSVDSNARGADSQTEFIRQRNKIIAAFKAADPAVIAISELENNASTSIADLVDDVNSLGNSLNTGNAGKWAYISTGVVGSDAIRVAFIYQPGVVTPVGTYRVLDSTINSQALTTRNRPAIAQTFKKVGTKSDLQHFTVVANHFKSKGSACTSSPSDPDLNDGQDNCNLSRVSMAVAQTAWLATNPTSDPTPAADRRILIVGDLNAHLKEDTISALTSTSFTKGTSAVFPSGITSNPNGVYKDLVSTLGDKAGYSYLFSGESGALDHALANPALFKLITGVSEWHINADEPVVFDYNSDYDGNSNHSQSKSSDQLSAYYNAGAFRTSDHDPLLVGFNPLPGDLNDDGVVDSADQTIMRNAIGKPLATVDRRTDYDGDGRITLSDYTRWSSYAAAYQR